MDSPLTLIDLSHTSHSQARTGVQRVCRSLLRALVDRTPSGRVSPITWDPYARCWRELEDAEKSCLAADGVASRRGSQWPVSIRARGWIQRFRGGPGAITPRAAQLIVPEIFSSAVGRALPRVLSTVRGPRIAIFHDAIALRLPELTPPSTVSRFPSYLQELLRFDGVAAVSSDSRDALRDWWRWLRVARTPELTVVPLAVDAPQQDTVFARTTALPVVLSVGSLEGRKNHLALLAAAESLWCAGLRFELRLVGLAQAQTGHAVLADIRRLQQSGRPLRYDGPLPERALRAAYHECAFTVYPSLMEGFGLPVLESLAYGKPCVCSGLGALGESARGGGCVTLERVDSASLASAMRTLLLQPARLQALAQEAAARPRRLWGQYASELLEWMSSVPRRAAAGD